LEYSHVTSDTIKSSPKFKITSEFNEMKSEHYIVSPSLIITRITVLSFEHIQLGICIQILLVGIKAFSL